MKQFFLWTLVLIGSTIMMTACSSSDSNPEKVAEKRYLHYFDGSHPGPNDGYLESATNENGRKEMQQLLERTHKMNMEKYGAYKGYKVIDKVETPDGNKVELEMEFQHEKKNEIKEYTLSKGSNGKWNIK